MGSPRRDSLPLVMYGPWPRPPHRPRRVLFVGNVARRMLAGLGTRELSVTRRPLRSGRTLVPAPLSPALQPCAASVRFEALGGLDRRAGEPTGYRDRAPIGPPFRGEAAQLFPVCLD